MQTELTGFSASRLSDSPYPKSMDSSPKCRKTHVTTTSHSDYKRLSSQAKVIGVWDDHDYGMHDGDATFVDKHWFRTRYLEFIGENPNSKRFLDKQHGIYESYYLDGAKKVKIILLDIRFERTDEEDLGQAQIEWLTKEILEEATSQAFLIVTASPLVANDRIAGDTLRERTREFIIELVEMKKKFFLIISGEIHFAEFTQLGYSLSPGNPTDLWEIVSSGLSHSVGYPTTVNDFIMPTYTVRMKSSRILRCGSCHAILVS